MRMYFSFCKKATLCGAPFLFFFWDFLSSFSICVLISLFFDLSFSLSFSHFHFRSL
jgi:hypothetical protein